MEPRPYLDTYRRMLLDMHIPDHDPSFLTNYDPLALADLYARAKTTGVMLYTNSHAGLLLYPDDSGKHHPGLGGRDVVGELVEALRERDIRTCAYYSVLFDNWAVGEHPEWWISPIPDTTPRTPGRPPAPLPRYGICCPNKEPYVDLTVARISTILEKYDFDCLFYDMTFWAAVCGCADCEARFASEAGEKIPSNVDWGNEHWCTFQDARERWMREFVQRIVGAAKDVRPDIPVYNNFALSTADWVPGFSLELADDVDFLGGDMYGDREEQLVVSKLMLNLTKHRPAEFMTSLCINLRDHVRLRDRDDLLMKAYAATAHASACLFIDAIDPDGTVDAARYDLVGSVFEEVTPYEPFLGGVPVEDVAVYHSSESRMSLAQLGTPVGSHNLGTSSPHQRALRGACRMLQRAHIPFGVITRKQLDELDRYTVVVLPNVVRMDQDEAHAFREYVRRGGTLYASAYTSMFETFGFRHVDFMLSDLFGVACDGENAGPALYAKTTDAIADLVAPQRYVSAMPRMDGMNIAGREVRLPDVRATTGTPLATTSYPFGFPKPGTAFDRDWSSIHSWPPHLDTDRAMIVSNPFGLGRAIYSAFDIETTDAPVNERLFTGLITHLLDGRARFSSTTHPAVWITVFDQPEHRRYIVSLVNYQADLPPVPVRDVAVTLDRALTRVTLAPNGERVEHDGKRFVLHGLDRFAMVVCEYQATQRPPDAR